MHRLLGLDVGAEAIKGVALESAFRGFAVQETFRVKVEAGDGPLLDRQKAALASLPPGALQADLVAVALPGTMVATHVLTFPFPDQKRIEAALPFELEGVLPFDLDEVVWDYQLCGARDGKTEVLVGVVKKEELARVLGMLAEVGVDPQVVSLPPLTFANLWAHGAVPRRSSEGFSAEPGQESEEEKPVAVLDLGAGRSLLCVIAEGKAELARTIPWGGADLTKAAARAVGTSFEEAERWKLERASLGEAPRDSEEEARAAEAVQRALVPLVRELRQTLMAYAARTRRKVHRLLLAGGASRTRGLPEALARATGVEVEALSIGAPVALSPADAPMTPELALAIALALRAQGSSRAPRLNLRRGEFAFTRDFQQVRGKMFAFGAFAAILLLLAGANAFARLSTLDKSAADLDKALCEVTTRVLGKCETDYRVALSRLKGRHSPAAAIPKYSAMDIFAAVVESVPDDVEIKLEEIDIAASKARLRGETDAFETVDRIVSGLKGNKCLGEVKRGRVQRKQDGSKIEFTLDVEHTCGERS